ncbi:MAG: hypothetical protein GVY16_07415 [Planctomycetes bacterium]|jgi:Ca2+-binding EF-hand superfamily protein|nr:hypothetical protein [Phycisphaerae bacterium]NBB95554.1 hypothetical protein [Planctomycetota bacterium]
MHIARALMLMATALLAFADVGRAQDPSRPAPAGETAETRLVPDHCRCVVDPYNMGRERLRFFRAAGKDTELTQAEFNASRDADQPFARRFDHWKRLLVFDADGNGTIDWLEADTYRRDVRDRMLKAFDANGNGRLEGAERAKANAVLDTGRIPAPKRRRRGMAGLLMAEGPDDPDIQLLQRYDADGDGTLSEDELKTAMASQREQWRQQTRLRYDTDGDGELGKDERKAMYDNRIKPWQQVKHRLQMKLFDEDGDGQLSDREKAIEKEFGSALGTLGKNIRRRIQDIDGDGQVTDEERQIARKEMMVFSVRMMVRMRSMIDADADGAVTPEETAAFRRTLATGTSRWFEGFVDSHDQDGNGRFDPTERDELRRGLKAEVTRRLDQHDTNEDGRIDGVELEKVVVTWGRDAGVFPDELSDVDEGSED